MWAHYGGIMFFDKPIHDLTYQDVVNFCKRQLPEGKQLDYKYLLPKNHEKFAKTIASFANALSFRQLSARQLSVISKSNFFSA